MDIQVLVAAMNQTDHSLLKKMNIQSDVIVGNQCGFNSVEHFDYDCHDAVYLNFAERGVGLNRNNALMRATADIVLFADDDMIYDDNYVETISDAFDRNPKADVIIFNIVGREQGHDLIKKKTRVNYLNFLRYGTARIAVRLKSIKEKGIYFNQCFGGGTEHCHGEDNLFLANCLKNKLVVVAVPEYIATLTEGRESTWNVGYDEKYLRDQGYLYKAISSCWWRLLCLQDAIRRSKSYDLGWFDSYMIMIGRKVIKETGGGNPQP